ncbi:hypothetical protein IVA88_21755 [Bradyrhizobium sp. 149]|uniref:hypothetical protein n=1 Tax=Bradyrhizobium sp. 149 TaxID=2782624 RepID=UPI001FFB8414|nr:hypothetical protein [Bradyrhizobium sp. 149]MCK1654044.1 hypothetical protein [Bradyrhizobium sp. 149]
MTLSLQENAAGFTAPALPSLRAHLFGSEFGNTKPERQKPDKPTITAATTFALRDWFYSSKVVTLKVITLTF